MRVRFPTLCWAHLIDVGVPSFLVENITCLISHITYKVTLARVGEDVPSIPTQSFGNRHGLLTSPNLTDESDES